MSLFLPLYLATLAAVPIVHAFSTGAPNTQCGAVADMEPSHGSIYKQQVATNPYVLYTVSGQTTYRPAELITLTLSGSGTSFKGFLVQAMSSDGAIVGQMIATSRNKIVMCVSGGSGITHTDLTSKTSIDFQWQADDTESNDAITFLVTIVQDYPTYWVKQAMLTLTKHTTDMSTMPPVPTATGSQVTADPLPQTTAVRSTDGTTLTTQPSSQGGQIRYDPQCGSTKGCFVDCSGNDCKFMVTWRDMGTSVQFELYGKPDRSFADAWVAVGFSSDTRMGDDSVTECVFSNGIIQAFNSFNTGYSNRRLNAAQYGLDNVYGSYLDGVLFCAFVRQKSVPQVPEIFDLEQDWHIMFANGKVLQVPAWQLYMHSVSELPPASAASVDYQSVTVIGSAAKFPLAKAHGCLMIFAWVLFCGIGIMVARYYKSVWSDKTFMKLKIWFQVHRACMATALTLNVVACILILIEVKGYSTIPDIPGKGYLRSHPVLGIIVTILCLANPVMAFFRPGGDHDKRPIFNWAHWGVGMTAYILSAICICFGFQLGKASTPDYAIYIMIVYVFYIIAFDVVFEITECISKKEQKVKVEGMEMSTRNGTDNGTIPNGNHVTKDKFKHSDKIKTILLVFHIAFTGAFALVLVLVVALN